MPRNFFRIFVQYQDPRTYSYKGAPKPFKCPDCKYQWFFDPHVGNGSLTVYCKNCEHVLNLNDLFMTNYGKS